MSDIHSEKIQDAAQDLAPLFHMTASELVDVLRLLLYLDEHHQRHEQIMSLLCSSPVPVDSDLPICRPDAYWR